MSVELAADREVVDCLILGFNDLAVDRYERMVRSMGVESGAYRDLALALVSHQGRPARALDVFTDLHYEGRPRPASPLHNSDFLWPTIPYLGSYLQRRGLRFAYVDRLHIESERARLRAMLRRGNIRSVAITTTLYVIPEPILELIKLVRAESDTVTIIVGGPYVTNNTRTLDADGQQRFFKLLGADVYIDSSEGEETLARVLGALRTRGVLDFIPNIAFARGGVYVKTSLQLESSDLVEEAVRYELFAEDIGQFVSLRTAKSCPFSCAFCGFPIRAGKYRYMGVERVESELDALRELGTVTTLTFLDDTFNVPKQRFRELLRMMIRKRYGFRWNSFYRADHGDAETIALMAEAGCEGVFLGVESGSDAVLASMKKTVRRRHFLRAIPLLREHGIVTHASLIIGFPGETVATVSETIELIERTRPTFYRAQLWYADPTTPVWKRREELGIEGEAFSWTHNTMDWRTAAELVDRMFLAVESSTWLPQLGFELWSVFYLKRFGMSVPQIEAFVANFNAVIKARMLASRVRPSESAPLEFAAEPELMDSLRVSAQFDRGVAPRAEPVARYGGRAYTDAERFFGELFVGFDGRRLAEAGPAPGERYVSRSRIITAASASPELDALSVLITAFGITLLRATGVDDIPLLVARPERPVLPLRLRVRSDQPLRARVAEIHEQRAAAEAHARFGMRVVSSELCMALHGATRPRFDALLRVEDDGLRAAVDDLSAAFVLVVRGSGAAEIEFTLAVAASARASVVVDPLLDALVAAIRAVGGRAAPGVANPQSSVPGWSADVEQEFNFQ